MKTGRPAAQGSAAYRRRELCLVLWSRVQYDVLKTPVWTAGGVEIAGALGDDRLCIAIGAGVGVIEHHDAACIHRGVIDRELAVGIVPRRITGISLDGRETGNTIMSVVSRRAGGPVGSNQSDRSDRPLCSGVAPGPLRA